MSKMEVYTPSYVAAWHCALLLCKPVVDTPLGYSKGNSNAARKNDVVLGMMTHTGPVQTLDRLWNCAKALLYLLSGTNESNGLSAVCLLTIHLLSLLAVNACWGTGGMYQIHREEAPSDRVDHCCFKVIQTICKWASQGLENWNNGVVKCCLQTLPQGYFAIYMANT